jgi:hypothetical protein
MYTGSDERTVNLSEGTSTTMETRAVRSLCSLRDVADEFNAGMCRLQTRALVRIGDNESPWELVLDTEWVVYDNYGRPTYSVVFRRADSAVEKGDPPPEALYGGGPRDVTVIAEAFGIDMDARVWTKSSMYAKE